MCLVFVIKYGCVDRNCLYSLICEARRDGISKDCSSEFVRRPYPSSFYAEYVVRYRCQSTGYIGHIHVYQNEMCASHVTLTTLVPNSVETHSVSFIEKCVFFRSPEHIIIGSWVSRNSHAVIYSLGPSWMCLAEGYHGKGCTGVSHLTVHMCIMAYSMWLPFTLCHMWYESAFLSGAPRYPKDRCFKRYSTLQGKKIPVYLLYKTSTCFGCTGWRRE